MKTDRLENKTQSKAKKDTVKFNISWKIFIAKIESFKDRLSHQF